MRNPFCVPMVISLEFSQLPVVWSDVVNLVLLADHSPSINQQDLLVGYHVHILSAFP